MITIIRKDIAQPRLTISKTETRLKIDYSYSDRMVNRLKVISELIKLNLGENDKTLRGRFNMYYENIFIDMKDCNGNTIKSYKFEMDDNL